MDRHSPTNPITALASGSDPADFPQYVFAQLSNDTPTAEERKNIYAKLKEKKKIEREFIEKGL